MSIRENIFFVHGVFELKRYGGIYDPHGALFSPDGGCSKRSSQSAIGQRDWGCHIVRGGAEPWGSRFHPRGVGVIVMRRDSSTGDGTLSSPGYSPSTPQSISDRPVGLWSPHRAGWCRLERNRFPSPWCRSCGHFEGCLSRGWGPILDGCGGTGGLAQGATPAARASFLDRLRTGGRPMGLGLGKRRDKSHMPIVLYQVQVPCVVKPLTHGAHQKKKKKHTAYEKQKTGSIPEIEPTTLYSQGVQATFYPLL